MRELHAEPEGWFASRYVLREGGETIGGFTPQTFSEDLEVDLSERPPLVFSKDGWFSSGFTLKEAETDRPIGRASSEGVLSTNWSVETSRGTGELTTESIFSRACRVSHEGQPLIDLEPMGAWSRGWVLRDRTEQFPLLDLVLVGLAYHTILERWRSSGGAGGAGGGGGG